jgi:hypothetical protein
MDAVPFMVSYGCALCSPTLSKCGYENKHLKIHYSPSISSKISGIVSIIFGSLQHNNGKHLEIKSQIQTGFRQQYIILALSCGII